MSPMLWSLLFIYFTLLFLIFNILNYFNFIPALSNNSSSIQTSTSTKKSLNWKW
nr:ATP synthase F0 subunit 8 [Polypedilum unifascium]